MTIFDILTEITYNKSDLDFKNPEIDKLYDIYMINRWISMVESYIPILDACNYIKITKQNHYNYLKAMIPKNKIFFKYIKKDLEVTKNYQIIAKFYKVSIDNAKLYYDLLDENDIQNIKNYIEKVDNGNV